jgi:eukaryotic-like serine/threonine-protein kinase
MKLRRPVRLAVLLGELKRRHVIRVTAVYLLVGWLVIQVAETVLPALELPAWTVTFVVVLVLLGMPMAVGLAWAYDITPEGVTRTRPGDRAGPAASSAGAGAGEPAVEPRAGDAPTRVIVLPFRMLRPDAEADFLAFSLADAITCSLSALESLVVRSQLAALRLATETPDLGEIADRAQVDVVVTGSILRAGDRLRITAALTDVREGTLLWSQDREIEMGDLFRLQDDLTRSIVSSLRPRLTPDERHVLERDVPATARVYEHYLRANRLAYELGQWQTARDLYLLCVEEDPSFAPAWARLGRCYRLLAKYGVQPDDGEEAMARARDAFERALRINPRLSVAHNLYAQLEVDLGRTEDAMRRLLGLLASGGSDPEPYAGLVHACRFAGLLEESRAAHRAVRRIDPTVLTSVNHTYWMMGDYEKALESTLGGGIGYLPGLALASMGRTAEAIDILGRHEAEQEDERPRAYLRSLRALLEDDRPAALAALEVAAAGLLDGEAVFYLGRTYARLGEEDRALDQLERAVQAGFACERPFADDSWLDPLRHLPRFETLRRRVAARHERARAAFLEAGGGTALPTSSRAGRPYAPAAP